VLQFSKLILMKAAAASEAARRVSGRQQQACKGRANCLKPKETGKACRMAGFERFDLRGVANYLKLKMIARHPLCGCWS
jgi:hypothetical protein